MNVAEILSKKLMSFDVHGASKKEVIENITDLMVENGIVDNKSAYVDSVMRREHEGTTGVGNGIAIPHGKSQAVTKSAVAFVKLKRNVDWQALDDKPVNMVFLLAIPEQARSNNDHLKVLSRLATSLMDEDVIQNLQKSTNEDDVINAFKQGVNE